MKRILCAGNLACYASIMLDAFVPIQYIHWKLTSSFLLVMCTAIAASYIVSIVNYIDAVSLISVNSMR